MTVILYFLYAVDFLVAILLITLILLQRSRSGGGLGGLATNSAAIEETLGAGAANVLQKTTAILAIIFLVCTVSIGLIQQFIAKPGNTDPTKVTPLSSSTVPPPITSSTSSSPVPLSSTTQKPESSNPEGHSPSSNPVQPNPSVNLQSVPNQESTPSQGTEGKQE